MKLPDQKLSKLDVQKNWTNASMGTILSIVVPDIGPVVAIRSAFQAVNGMADGVVILSDPNLGKMYVDPNFYTPAIELLGLQLGISNATVERYKSNPSVGTIVMHPVGPKYYVWTNAVRGSGSGWVRISSPANDVGHHLERLPTEELVVLKGSLVLLESTNEDIVAD